MAAGSATAQATDVPSDVRAAAQSHQWRALLGYQGGEAHSDVVSDGFFLAADGDTDPEAELLATREAMVAPADADPDAHAQCRFPARYLFLKSRNLLSEATSEQACPKYRKWLGDKPLTGASVIFASGHLSNPATFYGHMMVRLSTDEVTGRDALLETAMNYGAVFPENENGLVYIAKGISGGYRSTWSNLPFYQHVYRYSEVQMRDVWEYQLNLTPDQTALLAAHAWEMQGAYNRYYFLKQNCAYRIAELIGAVLEAPVIPTDKPWVMPVDVLDSISLARNGDAPLLKSAVRLDSRQTRLRAKYTALDGAERSAVSGFLRAPEQGVEVWVSNLDAAQQSRVLETLIDYFTVAKGEGKLSVEEDGMRRQVLLARIQRPAGASDFGGAIVPVQPHEGQKSSMLQVSGLSNSSLGEGAQVRFRAAYNDFLSLTPGALAFSELAFLDVRLDVRDEGVAVRSLDAVRLTTLNAHPEGLPGDEGPAWRLRIGAEQESLACDDCLVGVAEAHVGTSTMVAPGWVVYGLAGARLYPGAVDGPVQGGFTGGVIYNANGDFRAYGEASVWDDFSGDGLTRKALKLEARYRLSRDWDIGAGAQWEEWAGRRTTEVRAGLSWYW